MNPSAGWAAGHVGGGLFETFGDEFAFVRRYDPDKVWTLVDGDDGDMYVVSGFHLVNRVGYLPSRDPVPSDTTVQVRLPMHTDEAGRTERGKKRFENVRHTVPVYPLIEMGWSRAACVAYLRHQLPYAVPKSSCAFCPYRTNQSWRLLKQTDPEGWRRAVEIDTALRTDDSLVTRGFRQKCTSTAPASRWPGSTSTPSPRTRSTR